MNYLKHLFFQFTINQSQLSSSQQNYQNQPNESGQFQIIDDDDQQLISNQSPHQIMLNSNHINPSSQYSLSKLNCQSIHQPQQKNQHSFLTHQQKIFAQKLSKQYTVIQISPQNPKQNCKQQSKNQGSASTIQLDQYYMIVSTQQISKIFTTQQQWIQFYQKINKHHKQLYKSMISSNSSPCSLIQHKKISLNLKQLNSILQIKPDQIQKRIQYWNQIAVTPVNIKFKYTQLANKKDPKKLQQNVNKIITHLVPIILQTIQLNKYKPIQSIEDQIQKWKTSLIKILTFYGANDKQIGYSKGIQYIALGILVAKPFVQHQIIATQSFQNLTQASQSFYCQLQKHFKYLLFTKQLRNMYFPGTPKLYQQIQLLIQLMRNQVPELYQKLQQLKVDFIKLFINYYKTFLLYKIKNPQVIRKVMELLCVYGIDIVRIILTRIMSRNQKKIFDKFTQQIQLLRYLAQSLVEDYFSNSSTEQVITKFKNLFVLDTIH